MWSGFSEKKLYFELFFNDLLPLVSIFEMDKFRIYNFLTKTEQIGIVLDCFLFLKIVFAS